MSARLEWQFDGRVARIVLAAPKANLVDRAMVAAIDKILADVEQRQSHAIVFAADGPHFSYGASIPEHLPDQIGDALAEFTHLLRRIVNLPAPTIAAARGQCLGGGLELVLACDLVIAEEDARLGLPEIRLGVFPPAGSALLPVRIGAAGAAQLALTGESWSGAEAHAHGLVARVAKAGTLDDALRSWLESDFVSRSQNGLRHAALAVRRPIVRAIEDELPKINKIYLDQLMRAPHADEGIRAFLDEREVKGR